MTVKIRAIPASTYYPTPRSRSGGTHSIKRQKTTEHTRVYISPEQLKEERKGFLRGHRHEPEPPLWSQNLRKLRSQVAPRRSRRPPKHAGHEEFPERSNNGSNSEEENDPRASTFASVEIPSYNPMTPMPSVSDVSRYRTRPVPPHIQEPPTSSEDEQQQQLPSPKSQYSSPPRLRRSKRTISATGDGPPAKKSKKGKEKQILLEESSEEDQKWADNYKEQLTDPRGPVTTGSQAMVVKDDIKWLKDGQWFNDNLVLFYLRWLERNSQSRSSVLIFDTFLFASLTNSTCRRPISFDRVKRHTAARGANKPGVNIFNYDYIIVPIHASGNHWYAAIICNPSKFLEPREEGPSQTGWVRTYDPSQPRIMTLDSLGKPHSAVCTALQDWLIAEAEDK